MDINTMLFIVLAVSAVTDALIFACLVLVLGVLFFLFYKVFKNKIIVTENNREIHEHDKEIFELKEKVEELEQN